MKTGVKLRSNRWILDYRPSFQKSRTPDEAVQMLSTLIQEYPTLNPLLARLALEQLADGKVPGRRYGEIFLEYTDRFERGPDNLTLEDLRRATGTLAFHSIGETLTATALNYDQARAFLEGEHARLNFIRNDGNPFQHGGQVLRNLLTIGIVTKDELSRSVRFEYDPVAEFMAAVYCYERENDDGVKSLIRWAKKEKADAGSFRNALEESRLVLSAT